MKVERSALFYMANLGAEVSRLTTYLRDHDESAAKDSFVRSIQILNRLKELPEMRSREKELSILSDVIKDVANPTGQYSVSVDDLRDYFDPFALRFVSA